MESQTETRNDRHPLSLLSGDSISGGVVCYFTIGGWNLLVGGFHLRVCSTGSFHPAIADGNLLVWRTEITGIESFRLFTTTC